MCQWFEILIFLKFSLLHFQCCVNTIVFFVKCRIWWVYLYFQIRIWSKHYKVDVCLTLFLFLILMNQWLFIECSFRFFVLMTTFSNFFHKKQYSICTRVLHTFFFETNFGHKITFLVWYTPEKNNRNFFVENWINWYVNGHQIDQKNVNFEWFFKDFMIIWISIFVFV